LIDRLVRRLQDRYHFLIACLDQVGELGERLSRDGFKVVQLGRRPGFDWRCARQLRRLFAAEGVKVVHAHQYTPFAYSLASRFFGRRPPVLFTEHGRFYPDYTSLKRKCFNKVLAKATDRFVAVGESVSQALIRNEGILPERIQVIHNGISITPATNGSVDRRAVRSELGASDEDFLVLQVARLDPIKDHMTAIRAIACAAERNPRIRLLIVGEGKKRAAIEREINGGPHGDRFLMLGQRTDVHRLLAAADAFLLTSVSEGIPVTIIEAMAAGVPVVATAVGGIPELITDQVSGLLASAGDAEGIADSLVRLAADANLRNQLAARAKLDAQTNFSEERMILDYDQVYQEMLATSKAAISVDARPAGVSQL
jgi:glycosyltransferase involved in cell wall biosynthesis